MLSFTLGTFWKLDLFTQLLMFVTVRKLQQENLTGYFNRF